MIKETFYKDRPAIEISCEKFTALFLAKDGAKIASFKTAEGEELLAQAEGEKYRCLDLEGDYEKSECSAFDDMFPTLDPCVINGVNYLDHGEVCRREHRAEIDTDKVRFSCVLPTLNVFYKKTAYIKDDALFVEYHIENMNDFDFPYVWAGHIMFKGEEGAYAVSNLPPDTPITVLDGNPDEQTAHILQKRGNKNYKIYYTKQKFPLKCGIVYPESKTEVTVEFNNDIVKYLGLWVNPGDLNGMYNLAVEPCTALYDDPIRAKAANAHSYIKAHDSVAFTLKMYYKN